MKKIHGVPAAVQAMGSFVLLACLGLGCSDSPLKPGAVGDSAAGGSGGTSSLGGAPGSGGASALGMGGQSNTVGAGGSGGKGSSATGGSASGGAGATGIICPPMGPCPPLDCPNGHLANSSNPCSCPVCAPTDAGVGRDATADACLALPCAYVKCAAGQTMLEPACGCPTCVSMDAGEPDAVACPKSCPAVRCAYGTLRDPVCGCDMCVLPDAGADQGSAPDGDGSKDAPADACAALPCAYPVCAAGYTVVTHACGCPTCEQLDAGSETGKLDCAGLDECSCATTNGCGVIADACYCPYPKCIQGGACICGGGKFLGCASTALTICPGAKARIFGMCPTLSGPTFDNLCQQSDSACITKCLNDVTSCNDVRCTFCEGCDCATDPFSRCVAECTNAVAQ